MYQFRSIGMQACWLGCHRYGRSKIKSSFDGSNTSVASKESFSDTLFSLLSHDFCHMTSNVEHFCNYFVTITSRKTESRDECNQLFDRDPSTSWIKITNDNLCFGQADGGIDACQVKKCFACQVITSNKHCGHLD